jgi:predicted SnoaL-like aldol condensation-catalyzing enzyme
MSRNEDIARELWSTFNARKFYQVKPLLHDDFVCIWPQSREIIRGANNFMALNENYPGKWSIKVIRTISTGDIVISEIELKFEEQIIYAVSFFEIKDGKILRLTEYWGDSYEAPEWRSKWVEKF